MRRTLKKSYFIITCCTYLAYCKLYQWHKNEEGLTHPQKKRGKSILLLSIGNCILIPLLSPNVGSIFDSDWKKRKQYNYDNN